MTTEHQEAREASEAYGAAVERAVTIALKAEREKRKHNGFTNFETWCVALWIDNEEGSYRYWRDEAVSECRENSPDDVTGELAARLKSEIEDDAPDLGGTMWSDLLNAALSQVNWHEIAEHLLAE